MHRHPNGLALLSCALLVGLTTLPSAAVAQEPPPPPEDFPAKVALDFGGTLGALRHPAASLPPSPIGIPRSTPDQASAARMTFGVALALGQFFPVENLWESNSLDWYFAGDLRVFSVRLGLEKELPLSRRFSLGLAVHGAVAEASIGTGETVFNAPSIPDSGPGPDSVDELRANQWLFGVGASASLLILTNSPIYFRLQAGYTQYLDKAHHFETRGKDYTPEGFSMSLSGPLGGVSAGVRL
jgi:hypothetical protein